MIDIKNFFLIFMLICSANAEIIEEDTISYYEIKGTTFKDVHQSLRDNTTLKYNDNYFFAINNSEISLGYTTDLNNQGNCYLKDYKVYRKNNIVLPKLTNIMHIDINFKKKYNYWYQAIYKHELNHTEITKEIVESIERHLEYFPEAIDCITIDNDINEYIQEQNILHDSLNVEYDEKTNHGETEDGFINDYL